MLTGYLSTFCIGKSYKRYLISRFCVYWGAPTPGDYDGDSGSFILNGDGAVTGLLWGGVLHEDLDVGLASSMSDVMESIKEKIGGLVSVELPQ
ncbi:hypothetical protein VN97_g9993 [Penicillium thymicola]|uniref:Uncharacterized protein n=1 Tax=Penicillium thymicola TaxID=293382 RepID=A0AAI9X473_PENTH|nr:hypothetical protein VN97_g9993 [Penicillium thymicola]